MKSDEINIGNGSPARTIDMTVRRGSLNDDHDLEYMEYFLSRPVEERVSAVEILRKAMHGEDYAVKCRLSRSTLRIKRRPLR